MVVLHEVSGTIAVAGGTLIIGAAVYFSYKPEAAQIHNSLGIAGEFGGLQEGIGYSPTGRQAGHCVELSHSCQPPCCFRRHRRQFFGDRPGIEWAV